MYPPPHMACVDSLVDHSATIPLNTLAPPTLYPSPPLPLLHPHRRPRLALTYVCMCVCVCVYI